MNSMPKDSKTAWKTPELVVLGRSRPEEAVLTVCKRSDDSQTVTSQVFRRRRRPPTDGPIYDCCMNYVNDEASISCFPCVTNNNS